MLIIILELTLNIAKYYNTEKNEKKVLRYLRLIFVSAFHIKVTFTKILNPKRVSEAE